MTISLHTQTSVPNTAVATRVSPLEQSDSSKTKFSQTRTDIYQTITNNIIATLEAGVKPWSCPWQRVLGMSGLQCVRTGLRRFTWMTYRQAQAVGGQVRKGEHGTTAIFYTTLEKENEDGEIDQIPMLKTFNDCCKRRLRYDD
ncbi:ArdC-like ssDNA-binding domain-containing protein [Pectobacterium versatile]|uniref:ArdC-like ssDNA-binding domain-containing protein n=1 Tax=Pectobacterium versatile TaxID=2488639 RepID=UPI001F1C8258